MLVTWESESILSGKASEVLRSAWRIPVYLHTKVYPARDSTGFTWLVYEDDKIVVAHKAHLYTDGTIDTFIHKDHRSLVILKNGKETLLLATELPFSVRGTVVLEGCDYSACQYRPGEWVEHLLSLGPKVSEAKKLQDGERQELERVESQAHFGPVD